MDNSIRHQNWNVTKPPTANWTYEQARLGVLMDIREAIEQGRDALRQIVGILQCHRFQSIPSTLNALDRRVAKKIPLRTRKAKLALSRQRPG